MKNMKLLIAGEVSSAHTARWINQLKNTGWDIHVYQVTAPGYGIHPHLEVGRIHYPLRLSTPCKVPLQYTTEYTTADLKKTPGLIIDASKTHQRYLRNLLLAFAPDVIHSHGLNINWNNLLEPVRAVLESLGSRCSAPWLYSTWGSDLDYYAKSSLEAESDVKSALQNCDFLTSECRRDKMLAQEMGFKGKFCGFFPDFGGVHLDEMNKYRKSSPSRRKIILVKGRDCQGADGDPVGRAMSILKALEKCRRDLAGYTIAVTQATALVKETAEELRSRGLDVVVHPRLEYNQVLALMARSRVFISATINDGLPSSLVEAMVLGAFPVYSDLAPIREWISHGENGFLVPADDVESLAACIQSALLDDQLVDMADKANYTLVKERLGYNRIRRRVIDLYRYAASCEALPDKQPIRLKRQIPVFSVIIPTYNQERFLPAALGSLLDQTYPHWEAIIVNDGSTDATAGVMEKYAYGDGRFRTYHKENGGVASALNEGLRHARGQWICWLSSDDLFEPNKLEVHLEAIDKNPKIRFFYSHFYYLDDSTGTKTAPDLWNPVPETIFQVSRMLLGPYIHGNSVAIHRSVFEEIGTFDEKLRNGQDFDMWLRISARFPSHFIDRRTCITRWHAGQTTNLFPEAGFFDSARACASFLNTHSFQEIFPLIDFSTVDGILKALQESLYVSVQENSIMNACGCSAALLERLCEWLYNDCPQHLRQSLLERINKFSRAVSALGSSAEIQAALGIFQQPRLDRLRFFPHDFMAEASAYAQKLTASNRAERAASLTKYLDAQRERKTNVLIYYAGLHNSDRPFAGTNMVIASLARELGKGSSGYCIDLTGDFVIRQEALDFARIVTLPVDQNGTPTTAGYDVVIFASHLRSFQNSPKPHGQIWILHQHCWSIEPIELERLSLFDRIVALNRSHRNNLVSQGIRAEQVITIANGIDPKRFSPQAVFRKPHSIMFSGAVVPHKGLHILLQAFPIVRTKYPKAELNIYGSADMWHKTDYYEKKLMKLGVDGVFFHGAVPNRKMPVIYSRHDILCLPSQMESFGMVTVEAQACGCIPVVHAVGGAPHTLIDQKTGFLYSPNKSETIAESIIAAIEALRNDPHLRTRVVEYAHANFNIMDIAKQFEKLLTGLGAHKTDNGVSRLAQLNREELKFTKSQDYLAALSEFEKELKSAPKCAETHYNVGLLYFESGNTAIALENFIKAVECDPDHKKAIIKCAEIFQNNNLGAHAQKVYSLLTDFRSK